MSQVALIIPCYNEELRLDRNSFAWFIENNRSFDLFFVNDGSTDNTLSLLNDLRETNKERIFIINKKKNQGKAAAIRDAALHISQLSQYDYTGYTDADLSTNLEECIMLANELMLKKADSAFGSRIKKYGTSIQRSAFRHISGRIIATIIDSKFKLGIYDTQCGAKFFPSSTFAVVCDQPFKTKWLFDVEIFLRLFENGKRNLLEIPLTKWKDPGHSKLSWRSFLPIVKEVYLLFKHYDR